MGEIMTQAEMYERQYRAVARRADQDQAAGLEISREDSRSMERYARLLAVANGTADPTPPVLIGDGAPWPATDPGTVAI
jgi:hypothetical protein